jgi:hypothetical protein
MIRHHIFALALAIAVLTATAVAQVTAQLEVYMPYVEGLEPELMSPPPRPQPTPIPAGPAYFVDCVNGNDAASGKNESNAWRSLNRAKNSTLLPGDRLLLKRGCTWTGPLDLRWVGTTAQPITIDAYGTGYKPIIQNAETNVVIRGTHLVIRNIATRGRAQSSDAGCQNQAKGWAIGFRFEPGASYNTLEESEATGHTHGVKIVSGAHHNRVLSSVFANNRLMFILDASNPGNDAGANGIVLEGDDNQIAYNYISGHDACSFDFVRDGSAVEVYGGQRNRVHHNIVANNNTFVELGNPRSSDNTFAYNVVMASIPRAQFFVTEGSGNSRGPVYRSRVYNNTVYLTHPTSTGLNCDGGCSSEILSLKGNIIWSEGRIGYIDQRTDEGNNVYWRADGRPGIFFPTPSDMAATSKIANPLFVKASVGGGDFRLRAGSPAIGVAVGDAQRAGFPIDLAGVSVPQGGSADAGAYEYLP